MQCSINSTCFQLHYGFLTFILVACIVFWVYNFPLYWTYVNVFEDQRRFAWDFLFLRGLGALLAVLRLLLLGCGL